MASVAQGPMEGSPLSRLIERVAVYFYAVWDVLYENATDTGKILPLVGYLVVILLFVEPHTYILAAVIVAYFVYITVAALSPPQKPSIRVKAVIPGAAPPTLCVNDLVSRWQVLSFLHTNSFALTIDYEYGVLYFWYLKSSGSLEWAVIAEANGVAMRKLEKAVNFWRCYHKEYFHSPSEELVCSSSPPKPEASAAEDCRPNWRTPHPVVLTTTSPEIEAFKLGSMKLECPDGSVKVTSKNWRTFFGTALRCSSSSPDSSAHPFALAPLATMLGINVAVRRDPTSLRFHVEDHTFSACHGGQRRVKVGTMASTGDAFERRDATQPVQVVVHREVGAAAFLTGVIW